MKIRRPNFKVTLALLFLSVPMLGTCQSLGYADADNPGEAIGMMKTSIHVAKVMREQCVAKLPELQQELDANLLKWKKSEASVLKKTEFHWVVMEVKQPKISDSLVYAEKVVKSNIENIVNAPGSVGNEVLSQYCRQHFADLASGIWRKRTPRAYGFMDRIP